MGVESIEVSTTDISPKILSQLDLIKDSLVKVQGNVEKKKIDVVQVKEDIAQKKIDVKPKEA